MAILLKYPRVLVVNGEPISAATATGITMNSLFAGWPTENLAQLFTSPVPHERRSDFEHRLLPGDRRGLSRIGAWMEFGRERHAIRSGLVGNATVRTNNSTRSSLRKWLDLLPYELPPQVHRAVLDFRPDVVYSCLGNIQISALALRCAELCGVSVVPHFMDDWIRTMYSGRPDLMIQRRCLINVVRKLVRLAPIGMTISELMADEYSSTYGADFRSFMNCTPVPAEVEPEPRVDQRVGLRLVYVGGLHLERWRPLNEIGEALACVNSEGSRGKLYVYAPPADIRDFGPHLTGPAVEIAGSLAQHEVPGALKAGHVLVHIESFEASARRYTRLSVSTKIPQYMAAGRPLLCYGPGEIASCMVVKKNECGLVVGSQDKSALISAVRLILQDARLRGRLGNNAWATARRDFDAAAVTEEFRSVLAEAAWGHRQPEAPGILVGRGKCPSG